MNTAQESLAADYDLPPSELFPVVRHLVSIKRPLIIWGPPGVGKSAICRQVADALNLQYIDVRVLLMDLVDLRGLPFRNELNQTSWAAPDFLPPADGQPTEEGKTGFLINLDELASGKPSIQAALYQLVLDRAIGQYRLPDNAVIVACSNRLSDRAVVHRMGTALATRFLHLNLSVSNPDWYTWARANNIAPQVLFFLQYRPDLLHNFDPESTSQTFPCPRTWEFVSDAISTPNGLTGDAERSMLVGAVGQAAAIEFSSFLDVCRELPHPQTVLDDPLSSPVPENDSHLLALCGTLYRIADRNNLDAIFAYARRLRFEVATFLADSCVQRYPELIQTSAYSDWASYASRQTS